MVVLDILVVIYGWSFSQPLESYCSSWLGCLNHLYSLVQGIIRGSRYVSMTKSNSHIPFCKAIASLPPHPHCRCYTHSLCLNSSHHSLWNWALNRSPENTDFWGNFEIRSFVWWLFILVVIYGWWNGVFCAFQDGDGKYRSGGQHFQLEIIRHYHNMQCNIIWRKYFRSQEGR